MGDDITYYIPPQVGDLIIMTVSEALAGEYISYTGSKLGDGAEHGPVVRSIRHNVQKAGGSFDIMGEVISVEYFSSLQLLSGETVTVIDSLYSTIDVRFPTVDEYLPDEPRVKWGSESRDSTSGPVSPVNFVKSLAEITPDQYVTDDEDE